MTPRIWFALALRTIGAWEVVQGLLTLAELFNIAAGLYRPSMSTAPAFLTLGFVQIAVGLALLKGAPLFASWFYPTAQVSKEDAP